MGKFGEYKFCIWRTSHLNQIGVFLIRRLRRGYYGSPPVTFNLIPLNLVIFDQSISNFVPIQYLVYCSCIYVGHEYNYNSYNSLLAKNNCVDIIVLRQILYKENTCMYTLYIYIHALAIIDLNSILTCVWGRTISCGDKNHLHSWWKTILSGGA